MGSLQHEDFYLLDLWPGAPTPTAPMPPNSFDSTQAGNHAASGSPTYPVGTKIQGFQDATVGAGGSNTANKGYYTMMYLQFHDLTGGDCSAGAVVTLADGSTQNVGELGCARDCSSGSDVSAGGPAGVTCVSIADTEYGWVWVGGIMPNYDVTSYDDLTGVLTDGNVVNGAALVITTDASQATLGAAAGADVTTAHAICGFAFNDDT